MTRDWYTPGPADQARVHNQGERWTLVLVRQLRHPPATVWRSITDPALLREWAPFDSDGNLGTAGKVVKLSTVGTPSPCLDVLDHALGGTPLGRMVGPEVMKFEGWQRLNASYAEQFGSRS